MKLDQYLSIFKARWLIVALGVLLGLAVGVAYVLLASPRYESSTNLYVSAQGAAESPAAAYQGGLLSEQRITSFKEIVASPRVAQGALALVPSAGLTANELASRTTATSEPDSLIIDIMVSAPTAELSAQLTNAVAASFTQVVSELEQPVRNGAGPTVAARVIQPATSPLSPVSPDPIRDIGLTVVLGLLFGCLGALVADRLDRTVKSVADFEALVTAPVIASVPFDENLDVSSGVLSRATGEAMRLLRTNLEYLDVEDSENETSIYVVTSAAPGDGKSTTCVNLSRTIALTGRRVAVVEVDLRRPSLATYLGVEKNVGLVTALSGKVPWNNAIQHRMGVDFLVAGGTPPNPSELLGSAQMERLLSGLRTRYDTVLLDAPPVLSASDALVLARSGYRVLLVGSHRSSDQGSVAEAAKRIHAVGGKVAGAVLNKVRRSKIAAYSGYYYEDYSSSRAGEPAPANGVPEQIITEAETDTRGIDRRPSPARRPGS